MILSNTFRINKVKNEVNGVIYIFLYYFYTRMVLIFFGFFSYSYSVIIWKNTSYTICLEV